MISGFWGMVGWFRFFVGRFRSMVNWFRFMISGFRCMVCWLRFFVGRLGFMVSWLRFFVSRFGLMVSWLRLVICRFGLMISWLGLVVSWLRLVVSRLRLMIGRFWVRFIPIIDWGAIRVNRGICRVMSGHYWSSSMVRKVKCGVRMASEGGRMVVFFGSFSMFFRNRYSTMVSFTLFICV